MHKICTIIPVYNEASRLDVDAYERYIYANKNHFIIFVNDGSTDESLRILNDLANTNPENIFIINIKNNSGKAEAVRQGIIWADGMLETDFFGYIDADLATPLEEIEHICSHFENPETQIAFGSRIKYYGSNIERYKTRHYFGRVFATYSSIMLNLEIYDTQCGAKYFRKTDDTVSIFKEAFLSKWFFDIELFLRYRSKNGESKFEESVKEIPLNTWIEKGNSKLKVSDFLRTPFEIIKIRNKYIKTV